MNEFRRRLAAVERRRRNPRVPDMTFGEIVAALGSGRVSRSTLDALSRQLHGPVRAAVLWSAATRRHLRATGAEFSEAFEPVSLTGEALSYLPTEEAPEGARRWLENLASSLMEHHEGRRSGMAVWAARRALVARVIQACGIDKLQRQAATMAEDVETFWSVIPRVDTTQAAEWVRLTEWCYVRFDAPLLSWRSADGGEWWTSVDDRGHHGAFQLVPSADAAVP